MRVLDHVTTANSNLRRSKLRTFLTILAIVIGAFTFAMSLGLGEGIRSYINSQIGQYEDTNLYQVSKAGANPADGLSNAFSGPSPEEYDPDAEKAFNDFSQLFLSQGEVEDIFSTQGVDRSYRPYTFTLEYVARNNESQKYGASGSATFPEFQKTVLSGDQDIPENSDDSVLLANSFVEALGFENNQAAIGQPIFVGIEDVTNNITEVRLVIRGVISPSIFESALTVNIATAKRLAELQKGELAESFPEVFVTKDAGISEEDFKNNFAEKGFRAQSIKDAIGTINSIIDAMQIGLGAFSSVAILSAIVGVVNTLFMAVLERTKEIGLFRSLGASKRTIFTMFSFEALLIGFWGSVIGLVFANIGALVINSIASNTFLKGLEGFNLLGLTLEMHVIIIISISLISLLAGIVPAFKASRLNPIDALKYE